MRASIQVVAPNLYRLSLPTPFAVGPVNVYAATDDRRLTLIDAGPRTKEARTALEDGLAVLGYTLPDVARIVITHAHADHHGLAGDIVATSGAVAYSHPHNHAALVDYAAERAGRRAFYEQVLIEAGVPAGVRDDISRMTQGYSRFATSLPVVEPLQEGDELTMAGQAWRVLHMPGHTGGLICLYQPEARLFLSSDHLLRDISSNPLFEPPAPGQKRRRRALVDYVASLARTAALDIAIAWPGHGEPITDPRTLIEKRLAFHQRRADAILAALDGGPQTAYALSQAIFARLDPTERFLAVSETLAHLEWLEERGAVSAQRKGACVLWVCEG